MTPQQATSNHRGYYQPQRLLPTAEATTNRRGYYQPQRLLPTIYGIKICDAAPSKNYMKKLKGRIWSESPKNTDFIGVPNHRSAHLEFFVLGGFVRGVFCPWCVLSWGVLSVGCFVLGCFVLGAFVWWVSSWGLLSWGVMSGIPRKYIFFFFLEFNYVTKVS